MLDASDAMAASSSGASSPRAARMAGTVQVPPGRRFDASMSSVRLTRRAGPAGPRAAPASGGQSPADGVRARRDRGECAGPGSRNAGRDRARGAARRTWDLPVDGSGGTANQREGPLRGSLAPSRAVGPVTADARRFAIPLWGHRWPIAIGQVARLAEAAMAARTPSSAIRSSRHASRPVRGTALRAARPRAAVRRHSSRIAVSLVICAMRAGVTPSRTASALYVSPDATSRMRRRVRTPSRLSEVVLTPLSPRLRSPLADCPTGRSMTPSPARRCSGSSAPDPRRSGSGGGGGP